MKIALVLEKYIDRGSSGIVLRLSKYLVRKGHDVHVFTNSWIKVEGITFHKIPVIFSNLTLKTIAFTLLSTIMLKRQEFDIIFSQPSRCFTPNIARVTICFKEWHSIAKQIGISPSLSEKILDILEGYNLKKAKRAIVISNRVKKDLVRNYDIDRNKIDVVQMAVDSQRFNPKNIPKYRKMMRKKYKIFNEIVILFVGNLTKFKGLDFLLRAIPRLNSKKIKLLIVGGKYSKPYKKLARKLKIRDKVIFAGVTNEPEKFYAASDVFILPTLYDAFGLVATEAMATGLPVIVSKLNKE